MIRSKAYLDYIRGEPCISCSCPPRVDAHHFGAHGTGIKPDDYDTVPLCRTCHSEWHARGVLPNCEDRDSSVKWMLTMQFRLLKVWTYNLEKPDDAQELPKIYPRQERHQAIKGW